MSPTRILLSLLLIPAVLAPAAAATRVHEYRLDNGMKILVQPDRRAPVAVAQVWYGVGSSYEYGGVTGVSHVLEHMMFKGTPKHPAGEFSRIVSELGGRENAFTSRDYTAYYQVLANDRLPVAFELEADRMQNLALPPEEFAQEIRVVREERRLRTDDNPNSLTYEHFNAAAWLNSPYGIPVIGWMTDLEHMRVEDLRAWYERWYAPNNAVLVVVGDVDPDAVHALAREHFGAIPARDLPDVKPRTEVPQRGERRIVVKAPAELPTLLMGYKTPVLTSAETDWEPYALEVLAGVLSGGGSARLTRELVRGQEIAASAGAGYNGFSRLDNLFMFSAVPARGRTVAELEAALEAEIERLKNEPVDDLELERVKAQVVTSDIYERDSIQNQAFQLGALEMVGLGWRAGEDYVERIRAVTPEQVQAVARKYLISDRRTVARLDPQPIDPARPPSSFDGHLR
ncbi:MAG: pitrilysin family protein [Chromatiales bacterium]|nr:pitrilysin family protein [Chromatiales bacterium]